MTINRFIAFSVGIHIIILLLVYFFPSHEEKKKEEMITRLVSPEELERPKMMPPVPRPTPQKAPPSLDKKIRPMPREQRVLPPQPPVQDDSRLTRTPDKPVVPGEGSYAGKPLPEGVSPKSGKAGKSRDDRDREDSRTPGYSDREKLFDKSVIREFARKDLEKKQAKKDNAITFDTDEYKYAGYMRKLKERIESIWTYPPEAQARGLYGDLKIQFTIRKNGSLGAVELVRTSGYKILDDAAMKALRDAEPYWPIPDEWGMESYTIMGHFIYNPYGYYVR